MRNVLLFLSILCFLGYSSAYALEYPLGTSKLSGVMNFRIFTGAPIDEDFTFSPPEISHSLKLRYISQIDRYLVEINTSSFGIFGASPYVNLPNIKEGFTVDEAFVNILTDYGSVMIGRYAPFMPVSPDDYRTDGLLFGNPSLPVDVISLYSETPDFEYELALGYLNYTRQSALNSPSADMFIAARFGFDYLISSSRIRLSPSVLFSDLGQSFGFSLPFQASKENQVLEGEVALYNLLGTELLKEGIYPGVILSYRSKRSPVTVEVAHISQGFLPYLGNLANFGGNSNWNTGSSGVKATLQLKNYTYSIKLEKRQENSIIYLFTLEKRNLPKHFSPVKISLGIQDRQAFFSLQTGLLFNF